MGYQDVGYQEEAEIALDNSKCAEDRVKLKFRKPKTSSQRDDWNNWTE